MTELTFDSAKIVNEDGVWLCLKVKDPAPARAFVYGFKGVHTAILKRFQKKRSLDANAYFWKILDDIAAALGRSKDDLYLEYVKQVGPFKDFTLTEDEAKTFRVAWSMLGTGWPTEQVDYASDGDRVIIRAYYGSSQYNTKQMSRLIDMVVEDAKSLGIETMTPEELSLLKGEWGERT